MDPGNYSAAETLRDGGRVEIRALKPTDRADLKTAISRTSAFSLHRRFFAVKTVFTESEAQFFVDIDFKKHVALVAVVEEGGRPTIAAGARYVVVAPGRAEVAFMVIDTYQRKGLGSILLRHLTTIAKSQGLEQFVADVLPDNKPMLDVFEHSGLSMSVESGPDVMHVTLDL